MTPRQWALGGALALLGAAAWYRQTTLPPTPPAASGSRQPDYVADELQAVMFAVTGQPWRQLRAAQLRHYPDDGSSELDTPVLWLREPAQPTWQFNAARGWIARSGAEVRLSGAVRAARAPDAAHGALTFTTEALQLWPDTHYAETDRRVAVHASNGDWLTAERGMRVWWGEALRVELRGRVRAQLSVAAAPEAAPRVP